MTRRSGKSGREKKELRPPPNYSSRRVQVRLLLLVAACMTVLMLMPLAADPQNYKWMGFKNEGSGELPPSGSADAPGAAPQDFGADDDPLRAAQLDAWQVLLKDLPRDRRDVMNKALWAMRHGKKLSPGEKAEWLLLVNRFGEDWQRYLSRADASLQGLPETDAAAWRQLLKRLDSDWSDDLKPALVLPLDDAQPSPAQFARLAAFQAQLDELALTQVEDDREYGPPEKDTWIRSFEVLTTTPAQQIEQQSIGNVGYVQLFDQPKNYRGKIITVRGTARRCYTVPAPENYLGIETYYVYWVRPAKGPNSPIVVYALSKPSGFPAIQPEQSDPSANKIEEEVEVTGVFLKRWGYLAQDGPRTAPLLLAEGPRWLSPPATSDTPVSTALTALAICAAVAAVVAVGIAGLVYFWGKTNRDVAEYKTPAEIPPNQVKQLESVPTPPRIEETLASLAHERRND